MSVIENRVTASDVAAELTADVVVVGAGLSGLTAARRLDQAGTGSLVVLEASDRVGGRTVNLDVTDGVITEGGGQWLGPGQDRVLALIDELGLSTFKTYADGHAIYHFKGRRRTYKGDNPPLRLPAMLDYLQLHTRLEQIRCQQGIVAMAPADAERIHFTPDLPVRRAALQRKWHNGTETKAFAVYDRPFWRDAGLNGQAITDLPAAPFVIDNSPPDGSVGILLTFIGTARSGAGLTWADDVLDDPGGRRRARLGVDNIARFPNTRL